MSLLLLVVLICIVIDGIYKYNKTYPQEFEQLQEETNKLLNEILALNLFYSNIQDNIIYKK